MAERTDQQRVIDELIDRVNQSLNQVNRSDLQRQLHDHMLSSAIAVILHKSTHDKRG